MKRKSDSSLEEDREFNPEKRYKRRQNPVEIPLENSSFRPDWSLLPQTALVLIFARLNERSKVSLSRVCKSWAVASRHPCLWREKTFHFGKNYNNKVCAKNAVKYAKILGQPLKELNIVYRTLSNEALTALVNAFEKMTVHFVKHDTQLEKLSLKKLFFNSTIHRRNVKTQSKLSTSLKQFLETQNQLKSLDLSQISWNVDQAFEVLQSITSNAASELTHLYLRDYFVNGLNSTNQQRLMASMGNWTRLHELSINYNCLSDDVVDLLSRTCACTLEQLDVWAYKFDPQHHAIDDFLWKTFRDRAPALKTSWHLESIQDFRCVNSVMQKHLPKVTTFEFWNCSHPLDFGDERVWHNTQVFEHISKHFANTLEKLILYLTFESGCLDDVILQVLPRFRHLQVFESHDVIRQFQTILSVCRMQIDRTLNLQDISIETMYLPHRDMLVKEKRVQLFAVEVQIEASGCSVEILTLDQSEEAEAWGILLDPELLDPDFLMRIDDDEMEEEVET